MLGSAILKDGNPFTLHYVMFVPTILGQGTVEQQAEWMGKAWNCDIIGTYAQVKNFNECWSCYVMLVWVGRIFALYQGNPILKFWSWDQSSLVPLPTPPNPISLSKQVPLWHFRVGHDPSFNNLFGSFSNTAVWHCTVWLSKCIMLKGWISEMAYCITPVLSVSPSILHILLQPEIPWLNTFP